MSVFVESWNVLAVAWGGLLATAALQSAGWLAVIAAAWMLIRRRSSAHFGYALFLLPLLPLALPSLWAWQIEAPAALAQVLPAEQLDYAALESQINAAPAELLLQMQRPAASGPDQAVAATHAASNDVGMPTLTATTTPSWIAWTFLAWALIALYLLTAFVATQIRTRNHVRSARELSAKDAARVHAALARLGVKRPFQVLECDGLGSPAAWGILKRRILFPPAAIDGLDDQQLAWVLGHELAHHTRRDLLMGVVQRVLQIAWFFHPLVWWQCRRIDRLRECACDESAKARSQLRGKKCAQALLQVAAQAPRPAAAVFSLQTLHNDKNMMKRRITRLMEAKRAARAGMAPVAIPFLMAAAAICTTTLSFQPESADAQSAIGNAQSWLIDQQLPDGHWPSGPGFDEVTGEFTVIGVTGLVLMSLGQPSEGLSEERRLQAVNRGLGFLKAPLEDPIAYYEGDSEWRALASHSIALQAWLSAHKNVEDDAWRATANKAIHILLEARNPYGGWGYKFEPNGDQASYYTCFALRTLAAANELGFSVPKEALYGGRDLLASLTDDTTGRIGFQYDTPFDVRLAEKKESYPVEFTELGTALSIVTHAEWGTELTDSEELLRGIGLVFAKRPVWNESNSSVDYYYWYYGTEAMGVVGGTLEKAWNESLHAALLPKQLTGEASAGAFPALDAWSDPKATVHSTAVATLALQAAN